MSREVSVSIVVPVYNAEGTLRECVDSILAQTLKTVELILVDDGSTDRSGEICDEYGKKVPSVSVIHQKNGGAASARLEGVRAAKGTYVGFVDSDDMISPYMVETLFSAAVRFDLDCVKIETGDSRLPNRLAEVASADDFTIYTGDELKKKYRKAYIVGNETISMCDKIVKRTLLLSDNGEKNVSNSLEDFYINMNMALKYSRYGELNRAFYFVRYRKGSLSRGFSEKEFSALLKVQRRKDEIMEQLGCTEEERVLASRWFAAYAISLVTKSLWFVKGKGKWKKALEMLRHPQVVEHCRKVADSEVDCRTWCKMIARGKFRSALAMIAIRELIKRVVGKIRYGY